MSGRAVSSSNANLPYANKRFLSYVAHREPGKALQFYLRLRRPNVFDFIRDNNLFTDVQHQALLLVEFDQELVEKERKEKQAEGPVVEPWDVKPSPGITLLVDHTFSIPVRLDLFPLIQNSNSLTQIARVVQQLQSRPYFLFLYLHALSKKDPNLTSDFADTQV